jgi:hypothetical protein
LLCEIANEMTCGFLIAKNKRAKKLDENTRLLMFFSIRKPIPPFKWYFVNKLYSPLYLIKFPTLSHQTNHNSFWMLNYKLKLLLYINLLNVSVQITLNP